MIQAQWTLDVAARPLTVNIEDVTANDWGQVILSLAGVPAGAAIIKAVFTAKVYPSDSDFAPTTVQQTIVPTSLDTGTINLSGTLPLLTFNLLPADTAKLLLAHVYDVQVWVDLGAASGTQPVRFRTVLQGTIIAKPGVTGDTTYVPPASGGSVTIAPTAFTVVPGSTLQLVATERDGAGNVVVGGTVVWGTSNAAIATVSASGVVTGVAPGNVTITATVGSHAGIVNGLVAGDVINTIPEVINAADRNAKYPAPTFNQRVWRLDTSNIEIWNGALWATAMYGATNIDNALAGKSNVGHSHSYAALKAADGAWPTFLENFGITGGTFTGPLGFAVGATVANNYPLAWTDSMAIGRRVMLLSATDIVTIGNIDAGWGNGLVLAARGSYMQFYMQGARAAYFDLSGSFVLGADPGGGELMRVWGAARFGDDVRSLGVFRSDNGYRSAGVLLGQPVFSIDAVGGAPWIGRLILGTDGTGYRFGFYVNNGGALTLRGSFNDNGTWFFGGVDGVTGATVCAIHATASIANGNCFEFGHPNPLGYRGTLGAEATSGRNFIAFHAEAGSSPNTYRTRGQKGTLLLADNGGLWFASIVNPNADNQAFTMRALFSNDGSWVFGAADPGGGELVRIAGGLRANGPGTFAAALAATGVISVTGVSQAYMGWHINTAATNEKDWLMLANTSTFYLAAYVEALNTSSTALVFTRSGATVTGIILGTDPGGSEFVRIGGQVRATKYLTYTMGNSSVAHNVPTSIGVIPASAGAVEGALFLVTAHIGGSISVHTATFKVSVGTGSTSYTAFDFVSAGGSIVACSCDGAGNVFVTQTSGATQIIYATLTRIY